MFRVEEKELVFIDLLSLWLYFKYDCIAFETMFKLFKTASTFFCMMRECDKILCEALFYETDWYCPSPNANDEEQIKNA